MPALLRLGERTEIAYREPLVPDNPTLEAA
jgi:hypothetical protein